MNNLSDDRIVKEITESKKNELFGVLYDRHVHMVYNRCLSFLKSPQEAEDLTHDIFLKAFLKLGTFQNRSKFSTWLYSITVNFCIEYLRKKRIQTDDIDNLTQIENIDYQCIDESINNIKTEQLPGLLDQIDPEEKMLLLLKYQDDLSIRELAQLLEIGESAVKMRLSRAKQKVVLLYEKIYTKENAL